MTFVCRHCGLPLAEQATECGGRALVCPEHGEAAVFLQGADLDLGVVRDSATPGPPLEARLLWAGNPLAEPERH